MPISRDEFADDDRDGEPTSAERVVGFLALNRDRAFLATEMIVPHAVVSLDSDRLRGVVDRIREATVDLAVERLVTYLMSIAGSSRRGARRRLDVDHPV